MGYRCAYLDVGTTANGKIRVPGNPNVINAGWCQWYYGSYLGKMQPINFAQSILIPDDQGPNGLQLWLDEDINGTCIPVDLPANGFSAQTQTKLLNFALGAVNGIIAAGSGGVLNTPVGGYPQISTPKVAGGNTLVQTDPNYVSVPQEPTTGVSAWGPLCTILCFAIDIAQRTCMYNAAETYQDTGSFSGYGLKTPAGGVPRSAAINISSYPPESWNYFGSTGALMLGHFAWEYDGFFGPLQYLNAAKTWTVPELPTATGLYIILKPGVVGSINFGVNQYINTSIQTSLGEINLLAGKLSGLKLPKPA
jgi:hypothetical protein